MAKIKSDSKETPLMQQYNSIKAKYPGAVLLFRVGDFYETFGEDAVLVAKTVGIVLTKRANGAASHIELAGFPHHALDTYMPKLVAAGFRVAICDQLEDPKLTKSIVKRGVTELITPGVALNDKLLDHKKNNYLAALHFGKQQIGLSLIDISTGEFLTVQGDKPLIEKLLQTYQPAEILYEKGKFDQYQKLVGDRFFSHTVDSWVFAFDYAFESLTKQFKTNSLKGFGIENWPEAIIASGVILFYLDETKHPNLGHMSAISRIDEHQYVWLDRFTIRNLEILEPQHEGGVPLIRIIDKTNSPMGARLLRKWLVFPLKSVQEIKERQSLIHVFIEHDELASQLCSAIKALGDLERLAAKLATGRLTPREAGFIRNGLFEIEKIKLLCTNSGNPELVLLADQLNLCLAIREKMENELANDLPGMVGKPGVIKSGVNPELDELRKIAYAGKDYLLDIQMREQKATGITSLKVAFNNVFGYYLEVTNTHKDKVPAEWIRKQTLVNAERYITEELKIFEEKILGAEEKVLRIEETMFADLIRKLHEFIPAFQLNSQLVAKIDCLLSFATVATERNYVCPEVNDSNEIDIKGGRHPVIETQLPIGTEFITNDTRLNNEDQQILMITGPNMAGKSALLRQTALIVLLAQAGCFVPATTASIGLVDKIFSRVGASDNISSGESTFMVEMNETASIINNISNRSLIVFDEIGRGTSTFDGISIAWALVEYLHEHPVYNPRTLFATHYHELNEMENIFPRIKNFNISVKELPERIIFLRKLIRGGSEHSFGIHVAKIAGIPATVLEKAELILTELEEQRGSDPKKKRKFTQKASQNYQLSLFQMDDPTLLKLKELLLNIDINTITPVEALFKLHELKKISKS